jgi:hypothetical protein
MIRNLFNIVGRGALACNIVVCLYQILCDDDDGSN